MKYIEITENLAKSFLPKRPLSGNKGTFGRALAYIGSEKFPGAAYLAAEAMLRGGCGYTEIMGTGELIRGLLAKFPEAIYKNVSPTESLTDDEINTVTEASLTANATLIGSGSGCSAALARLTEKLISLDTKNILILDADALNSIARYSDSSYLSGSKRKIILTPHEMEFSRITGISTVEISKNRMVTAAEFAKNHGVTVVLKGNRTVITDGDTTYVNTTGSSALAKGGSGDTLSGLIVSLSASSDAPTADIAALACYIHGLAGDRLAEMYSEYGVTPSDLPREMAKVMKILSASSDI